VDYKGSSDFMFLESVLVIFCTQMEGFIASCLPISNSEIGSNLTLNRERYPLINFYNSR